MHEARVKMMQEMNERQLEVMINRANNASMMNVATSMLRSQQQIAIAQNNAFINQASVFAPYGTTYSYQNPGNY
jgi:hypothetical protein